MSPRCELRMLREITNHVLSGGHVRFNKAHVAVCIFCANPLMDCISTTFGHHDHCKVRAEITVHHRDGDHDNNEPKNRTLAHRTCHKSYHMKLQHKRGAFVAAREAKAGAR